MAAVLLQNPSAGTGNVLRIVEKGPRSQRYDRAGRGPSPLEPTVKSILTFTLYGGKVFTFSLLPRLFNRLLISASSSPEAM